MSEAQAAPGAELLGMREALELVRASGEVSGGSPYRIGVATSFTALHFETFVRAYAARARPERRVSAETGVYGDLAGTLDDMVDHAVDACVVVIEWNDLDPRLGWREGVGGAIAGLSDIEDSARDRLNRIAVRLEQLGQRCRTVVALPTLDLPVSYGGEGPALGRLRARLDLLLAEFADRAVGASGVYLVQWRNHAQRDLRSDIRSGFPHPIGHASALARACSEVLFPPAVKKGLITDLDDTLWRGLVGEVGSAAVTWDLDSGGQVHALYQQLLAALAERGVLIGVASKNDPELAGQALRRSDLGVPVDRLFPVKISWEPKSRSVEEILSAWNLAASDVVFVDDSPMELAEVQAGNPDITTVRFPAADPGLVAEALRQITRLLWRDDVTADDRLRVDSLRSAGEVARAREHALDDRAFLADLKGRITIRSGQSWQDPRARELVNKTNQFNLNGRRFDEAQWRALCTRPGAFTWVIGYEDRFGPLGTISVLGGVRQGSAIIVDCWAQSCRAFSRAIEHHVLSCLLEEADCVGFDFEATARNGVLCSLLHRVAPSEGRGRPRLDVRLLRDAPTTVHVLERDPPDDRQEP